MAITPLDRDVLRLNEAAEIAVTSKSAAFGADAKGGDYKCLFLFANAGESSATVTIAVGDGPLGAGKDLSFSVGAGKTMGIVVDSAYFKYFTGDYKDCYKITPSAALSVSVIELPQ
jgi:hypothetical protein